MSTSKRSAGDLLAMHPDDAAVVLADGKPTSRHHGKPHARWQADENARLTGKTFVVYLDSLGFIVCQDGKMQRDDVAEVYRTGR